MKILFQNILYYETQSQGKHSILGVHRPTCKEMLAKTRGKTNRYISLLFPRGKNTEQH